MKYWMVSVLGQRYGEGLREMPGLLVRLVREPSCARGHTLWTSLDSMHSQAGIQVTVRHVDRRQSMSLTWHCSATQLHAAKILVRQPHHYSERQHDVCLHLPVSWIAEYMQTGRKLLAKEATVMSRPCLPRACTHARVHGTASRAATAAGVLAHRSQQRAMASLHADR